MSKIQDFYFFFTLRLEGGNDSIRSQTEYLAYLSVSLSVDEQPKGQRKTMKREVESVKFGKTAIRL